MRAMVSRPGGELGAGERDRSQPATSDMVGRLLFSPVTAAWPMVLSWVPCALTMAPDEEEGAGWGSEQPLPSIELAQHANLGRAVSVPRQLTSSTLFPAHYFIQLQAKRDRSRPAGSGGAMEIGSSIPSL